MKNGALLVAVLALAGCAVGPDYRAPAMKTPDAFAAAGGKGMAVDPAGWWHALGDKQLDALVERAVAANPDVAIALDRLLEARTEEAVLLGLVLPQADAAGAMGKGSGSDNTRGRVPSLLTSADNTALSPTRQIDQVGGFDAVWQIDLFGQYRRAIEAGIYDAEAAEQARNQIVVTVIADVVRAYIDLRGLQIRLAVLRQNIEVARSSRDFIKMRYERGLTNELDLTLAERELSSLQAQAAPLQAERDAARYTIAVLLGRYPEEMAAELTEVKPIPALPPHIDPGLPLDLIKRRPDVQQSERQLAAATARIGVAIGNLFPHVALAGAEGVQSTSMGMEHATHIWSFGPAAYWPLLDFGALDAQVDIADLRSREQFEFYRKSLLNAVREVDSAVSDFAAQQSSVAELGNAVLQGQRAVALANERYDRGLTDFLNVVDAERQQYALEEQLIAAQQIAGEDFVAVFRSLGGGWQGFQDIPATRLPHPAVMAMFERLAAPTNEDGQ